MNECGSEVAFGETASGKIVFPAKSKGSNSRVGAVVDSCDEVRSHEAHVVAAAPVVPRPYLHTRAA